MEGYKESTVFDVNRRIGLSLRKEGAGCLFPKETFQNGISASPPGSKLVFDGVDIGGVLKYRFTNYDTFMDDYTIENFLQFQFTRRESKSVGEVNFGQGVKSSGCLVSPHGVEWISHDGSTFKLQRMVYSNGRVMFLEKPESINRDDHRLVDLDLSKPFVSVIAYGNSAAHDTWRRSFVDSETDESWLTRKIQHRYFDLSSHKVLIWTRGQERFRTLKGLNDYKGLHKGEKVPLVGFDGMFVEFILKVVSNGDEDAIGDGNDNKMLHEDHFGIIQDNEVYCYLGRQRWRDFMGRAGLHSLKKWVSVRVYADGRYSPSVSRMQLEDSENQAIGFHDFAEAIRASRPEWLLKMIDDSLQKIEMPDGGQNDAEKKVMEVFEGMVAYGARAADKRKVPGQEKKPRTKLIGPRKEPKKRIRKIVNKKGDSRGKVVFPVVKFNNDFRVGDKYPVRFRPKSSHSEKDEFEVVEAHHSIKYLTSRLESSLRKKLGDEDFVALSMDKQIICEVRGHIREMLLWHFANVTFCMSKDIEYRMSREEFAESMGEPALMASLSLASAHVALLPRLRKYANKYQKDLSLEV